MSDIERLKFPGTSGQTVLGYFKQLWSNGAIKLKVPMVGEVNPRNDDALRIKSIFNEIDDARSFYDATIDEVPGDVYGRIRETKSVIHELRQGLWADRWAESLIQEIIFRLGKFLTDYQRLNPEPTCGGKNFGKFESILTEMRLAVWTIVAQLYLIYNEFMAKPHNIPDQILQRVTSEYQAEGIIQ